MGDRAQGSDVSRASFKCARAWGLQLICNSIIFFFTELNPRPRAANWSLEEPCPASLVILSTLGDNEQTDHVRCTASQYMYVIVILNNILVRLSIWGLWWRLVMGLYLVVHRASTWFSTKDHS